MIFPRIFSIFCAAAIFLGFSGMALAQTESDVIAAVRAQLGADRQALVAQNLDLTEAEGRGFWPLYREFQSDRALLVDRRINLLRDFGDNFDGLTNEQSKQILDDYLSL